MCESEIELSVEKIDPSRQSVILTTFLLYLFNHVDVHESFILVKSEKLKVKV